MLSACSVYYTGNTAYRLKKANGEFLVKPNQSKYGMPKPYACLKSGQGKIFLNSLLAIRITLDSIS
jgi:hypothetical protein